MIVIPMAGMSSRFFDAGYKKPKYMLELSGESLFSHSVKSFSNYFLKEKFVFIIRDIHGSKNFVEREIEKLNIDDYEIIILEEPTRGQAETVAAGLKKYKKARCSLTIFNIDTFRPGFKYPDLSYKGNGYLEVFEGEGDNWSYVKPIASGRTNVAKTTEKEPISNLCSSGLYYFKHASDYFEAFNYYLELPENLWPKGELYIAPLYNYLISKGLDIHYNLIESNEVIFCGTPYEYRNLINEARNEV
ncbi:glycosyltransferase family 2 protein [Vibrio splendidus]